jgi:hypothetical protein
LKDFNPCRTFDGFDLSVRAQVKWAIGGRLEDRHRYLRGASIHDENPRASLGTNRCADVGGG